MKWISQRRRVSGSTAQLPLAQLSAVDSIQADTQPRSLAPTSCSTSCYSSNHATSPAIDGLQGSPKLRPPVWWLLASFKSRNQFVWFLLTKIIKIGLLIVYFQSVCAPVTSLICCYNFFKSNQRRHWLVVIRQAAPLHLIFAQLMNTWSEQNAPEVYLP